MSRRHSSNQSLALLTDLYQLTMAHGYWREGTAEQEAVFHLTFRKNPFQGGFVIAAGLEPVLDVIRNFHFEAGDLEHLSQIAGHDGRSIFERGFLNYLQRMTLSVSMDAIPEGTVVFPHEPLLRIRGPMIQCQLLETILLNIINFQSLIATKAARVVLAAQGDTVLEFGLRRAQGIDGGLAASRAAYIGGCAATSNVLAGKEFGIPLRGTHAHSWVMSFADELSAFEAYADAMPNNCVFLVDTYDTLEGVRKAIVVGEKLRAAGYRLIGIRLDSGDLAWLSQQARKLLDAAGFEDALIIASNDLDEHLIQSLKHQRAAINVWGVGTKLVTAFDQPALGGVYKLGAIKDAAGNWQPKIKLSEQLIKTSTPGILQVRRFIDSRGQAIGDMIFDELHPPSVSPKSSLNGQATFVDPLDASHHKTIPATVSFTDLLQPAVVLGRERGDRPRLAEIRERTLSQLGLFHASIKRFENPHKYTVGLELGLFETKSRLVSVSRNPASPGGA
jgi:nicotinate phosphoribosyltransferase